MAPLPGVDPIYDASVGSAQRQYQTTNAGLVQQRGQAALDYGYTPSYDEAGMVRSLAIDPNNPYSKANLLSRSYKENRARNLNSFAQRGQLYAGSLGVAQNLASEDYLQRSNTLQNSFINFIARNQGALNQSNTDYQNALAGADSEATARAVANDQGLSAGGAAAPAGGGTQVRTGTLVAGGGFGGGPVYVDSSGQTHEAKLGSSGYVYKNSKGTWTAVPGSASVQRRKL